MEEEGRQLGVGGRGRDEWERRSGGEERRSGGEEERGDEERGERREERRRGGEEERDWGEGERSKKEKKRSIHPDAVRSVRSLAKKSVWQMPQSTTTELGSVCATSLLA